MYLNEWNTLNQEEKSEIIHQIIKNVFIPFKIKNFETFEQNNIKLETAVLIYDDEEFVFVPGNKNITLGWNPETCDLGENINQVLQEEWNWQKQDALEEIKYIEEKCKPQIYKELQLGNIESAEKLKKDLQDDLNYYNNEIKFAENGFYYFNKLLKDSMSPIRTVNINPMIVQRDIKKSNIDYNKSLFKIPTEDEYEYLCNGGSRTFFRWGNSLRDELHKMYTIGTGNVTDFFYKPNMFGLHIAYDPYDCEYVRFKNNYVIKAGDGGCALCGGHPIIYLFPLFSAFYRRNIIDAERFDPSACYHRKIIRLDKNLKIL